MQPDAAAAQDRDHVAARMAPPALAEGRARRRLCHHRWQPGRGQHRKHERGETARHAAADAGRHLGVGLPSGIQRQRAGRSAHQTARGARGGTESATGHHRGRVAPSLRHRTGGLWRQIRATGRGWQHLTSCGESTAAVNTGSIRSNHRGATRAMRIGIPCYPTYGGSGVVATELGIELAHRGHQVHFISYSQPIRLTEPHPNIHFHEVEVSQYPLFEYPPYDLALATRMAEVAELYDLDLLHVHRSEERDVG